MPDLAARLGLLRRLGRARREAALIETMPWAAGADAQEVAAELIDAATTSRAPRPLLLAALCGWARLSDRLRDASLAAAGDDIPALLRELGNSASKDAREAAAMAASRALAQTDDADTAALIAVLVQLARDESAPVADCAREAIAAACTRELSRSPRPLSKPLEAALAESLRMYPEHRSQSVINAAVAAAAHAGPALRAWFDLKDEAGHMALRLAARRLNPRDAIGSAPAWLAIAPLAPVAIEWLELGGEEAQTRLLEAAHILRLRGRKRWLPRFKHPERLLPSDMRLAHDPPELRRASIRLAVALARPDRRLLHVSGFLADPDPLTRLHAVLALSNEPPTKLIDETLTDFALDPSPQVSGAATMVLSLAQSPSRRQSLMPAFLNLARSQHAGTRDLADTVLRELDIPAYTDTDRRWDHGAGAARATRSDPIRFTEQLRATLAPGPTRQRLAALWIIQRLRAEETFRGDLIQLLDDRDQRVAAKAATLLGRVTDQCARRALRAALGHSDGRVRADALSALANGPHGPDLMLSSFFDDPTPRVRANALRAAWRRADPCCKDHLSRLLEDPRPAHRLSGLWVAEVCADVDEASRVAQLAGHDPDPDVRRRAARCASRLQAAARLGWLQGDASPESTPNAPQALETAA